MPDPITGLIVGGTSLLSGALQSSAAKSASKTQAKAADAGIAEQRRQFDLVQSLLKPYVEAGAPALSAQQAMLGLRTPEEEAAQIAAVERSPTFQALLQSGEEALLQRASATGGLRGGNVQAALAQFRPQMLAQELESRYNRLGGLTSLGQQSAAGVGTAGMQTGSDIAKLLGERGAAIAGGRLGSAQAYSDVLNLPAQMLGAQIGAGGQAGFGSMFSDRRLKKNITLIGKRNDGLGIYQFDYVWGGGRQTGFMADEVRSIYPEAVSEIGGYMMVDYSKV